MNIDEVISPSAPPDVVAELRAVYGIVESLSTDMRIALVLRRVEGHTLPEIAAQMGLSLATVKRRLARVEALLEQRLRVRRLS